MSCAQCKGIAQEFDEAVARRELRRLRRRGPSRTTRALIRGLRNAGVADATFLDVGGGVGAVQHGLLDAGAAGGVHVDASPAYLEAARQEMEALGRGDRVRRLQGDFVDVAPTLEAADIVTLDRVLCCYHDMPALVDASASKARRLYGVVFPREHLPMRLAFRFINAVQRLRHRPFNVYLHGTAAIEARVRRHGFRKLWQHQSLLWQTHIFIKDGGTPAEA